MEKRFYRASEIAKIYGMDIEVVQNLCHSRGQKFATRLTPRGWFYIDKEKFDAHLERKQAKT